MPALTQRALTEADECLHLALQAAEMHAWDVDLATGALRERGGAPASIRGGDGTMLATLDEYLAHLHAEDAPRVQESLARTISSGDRFEEEFRLDLPNGLQWRRTIGAIMRSPTGRPERLVGVTMDTTKRKALEAELRRRVEHDTLTGLARWPRMRQRIEDALAEGTRPVLLFLDLDDFRAVNDSLGHAAGDEVLACVADRLLNATRGCDLVARLGGDEFGVLLAGTLEARAVEVVVERITASLRTPQQVGGRAVSVRASIGVARATDSSDADELLRRADVAMYHAKRCGKAHHEAYDPAMRAAHDDRLLLESDLRAAIHAREFELHFQPIVDLRDGRVSGVESLVRWRHPRRGLVPPLCFIGLAEETGLIVEIGRWVLQEACRRAVRWRTRDGHAPYVSVNVSGVQLAAPGLCADVRDALARSGLAPERLVLEITESVAMHDAPSAIRLLCELKALGVRLAVDDFGTGFSSLAYLQRFPVDLLKIDKTFVDGITGIGRDAALARTIVALGDALSLGTIAEGVEKTAQRDALAALGCQCAQGYAFAKPMDAAAFDAWLAAPSYSTPKSRSFA